MASRMSFETHRLASGSNARIRRTPPVTITNEGLVSQTMPRNFHTLGSAARRKRQDLASGGNLKPLFFMDGSLNSFGQAERERPTPSP